MSLRTAGLAEAVRLLTLAAGGRGDRSAGGAAPGPARRGGAGAGARSSCQSRPPGMRASPHYEPARRVPATRMMISNKRYNGIFSFLFALFMW